MRTKLAWSRVWGRWLAIVSLSVACSGAIVTGKETEKKSHTTTAPKNSVRYGPARYPLA